MKIFVTGDEEANGDALLNGYLSPAAIATITEIHVARGEYDPVKKITKRYHVDFFFTNGAALAISLSAQARWDGATHHGEPLLDDEEYGRAAIALMLIAQEREEGR